MNNIKKDNRNQAIDFVRIIACFMVIFAHVLLPWGLTKYSVSLLRFAVPYFLIVTGWHLYRDNKEDALLAAKKTLFKMIKFTFYSLVFISIVNSIVCLIQNKNIFEWFILFNKKKTLFEFVVFNRGVFFSSIVWYLLALLYSLIIYIILIKTNLLKKSYLLIIPLIIGNLIINYCFDLKWFITGNWLFTGLPFLLLGSYLRTSRWWRKVPTKISWTFIIIGVIMALLEAKLFPLEFIYFSTLLIVFGIVTLVLKDNKFKCNKLISDFGAKCTAYIFVIHCSLRDLLYAIFGKPTNDIIELFMPIIIFVISSIIAIIIVYIKDKYKLLSSKR